MIHELGFDLIGELVMKLYPLIDAKNIKANEALHLEVSDAIPESRFVEIVNNVKSMGIIDVKKTDTLQWEGKGGSGSMKTVKSFNMKGGIGDAESDNFKTYAKLLTLMEESGDAIVKLCPLVHKSIAFPLNPVKKEK